MLSVNFLKFLEERKNEIAAEILRVCQFAAGVPLSVFDSLFNLGNLQYLALNGCGLTGTLPSSWGVLNKLVQLWLYSNSLSGVDYASFF